MLGDEKMKKQIYIRYEGSYDDDSNLVLSDLGRSLGSVSILQIILYYLYKALRNDTLPTEIITESIKIKTAASRTRKYFQPSD